MKHERIAVTGHHLIKGDDPAPKTARMVATSFQHAFEGGEK
jgi:hypothetical protein